MKLRPFVLYLTVAVTLAVLAAPLCAATRSGRITMEVDLSKQPANQEVRLWLPYPVSDRDQSITDVKVTGTYAESAVYTDRTNGTPILYAAWGKDAGSRTLTLSFSAERQEVRRREFPAIEPSWNRADFAEYLKPTSLGPIDGEVLKLANRITAGKTTVLAKARAIYDWTCENMFRDPATVGCGKGDVCELLKRPGGKCTDISSVFIALCRAAGVPAREVFGIRLGRKAEDDITGWQHCWAEFYLPGSGWVTADPADVRKAMLVEKSELKDAKTAEYREYFWGGIDAYRIKLAVGRDLLLTPPQAGGPLNTFGYPYAEVGGTALDFYNPKTFSYRFTYREK
ncbi:MAG TPA: transglutaminase domain-containing protein, partial [Geobacteraceae bacterium]